jgi:hypothetical protein
MAKAKKAAPKKKALKKAAKKSSPPSRALKRGVSPVVPCTCVKFGRFYFCMVQKPDGSFEQCATSTKFKTLAECQMHSCGGE